MAIHVNNKPNSTSQLIKPTRGTQSAPNRDDTSHFNKSNLTTTDKTTTETENRNQQQQQHAHDVTRERTKYKTTKQKKNQMKHK